MQAYDCPVTEEAQPPPRQGYTSQVYPSQALFAEQNERHFYG